MDRNQWRVVSGAVGRAVRRLPKPRRRPRYPDALVVRMLLWAVSHDRPPSWSCDRSHYGPLFRPRKRLPSVSQFNRRVRTERVRRVLQSMHDERAGVLVPTALSYLDGKPLPVGVASKDPDAKVGHVMGGFARGYKLHAWMSEDRRIVLWSVMPLNVGEQPVAEALVWAMPELSDRALVIADRNYDTHDLHKAVDARNGRLVVRPRGVAHHPVTLRQMGRARRELLEVYQSRPGLIDLLYKQRTNAEGTLGNLCSYGGGLGPLPAWVRRLPRVRRWVGCKIILYNTRVHVRSTKKRAA